MLYVTKTGVDQLNGCFNGNILNTPTITYTDSETGETFTAQNRDIPKEVLGAYRDDSLFGIRICEVTKESLVMFDAIEDIQKIKGTVTDCYPIRANITPFNWLYCKHNMIKDNSHYFLLCNSDLIFGIFVNRTFSDEVIQGIKNQGYFILQPWTGEYYYKVTINKKFFTAISKYKILGDKSKFPYDYIT
jgi:hypothetical protein